MGANFIGAGALTDSASGNFTMAEHASSQAGDLLVACVGYRSNATITVPSGWVKHLEENIGNTTVGATTSISSGIIASIIRGASAPDLTFTRTAGATALGRVLTFRGVQQSSHFDAGVDITLAAASTNVVTGAGITTAQGRDLLVMLCSSAREDTASAQEAATDPLAADWTEDFDDPTSSNNIQVAIAHAIKVAAGATGVLSFTASLSARHVIAVAAFRSALSVSVSPAVVGAAGSKVDPTVVKGSLTVTPGNVNAVGAVVAPSVFLSSSLVAPVAIEARGDIVAPNTILGSLLLSTTEIEAKGSVVDPSFVLGEVAAPQSADARSDASIENILEGLGWKFGTETPLSGVWAPEAPPSYSPYI